MAIKVYDRDEWLKTRRREIHQEKELRYQQTVAATNRRLARQRRWDNFGEWVYTIVHSIPALFGWSLMYSRDPTIARQAIVYNAEKALAGQRQLQAAQHQEDRAYAEATRQQALADDEHRMKILAREMAKEMVAEVNRQRKD